MLIGVSWVLFLTGVNFEGRGKGKTRYRRKGAEGLRS